MSIPPYEPPKPPSSTPGVGNTLLCPKCAGIMKTYERNGVHLEQCDTCRGIFLDFGELESMTQMENRFVQSAPPPHRSAAGLRLRSGVGEPRRPALPQAGLRPVVLLQLDHPRARGEQQFVGPVRGGADDCGAGERFQHRPRIAGR